MNWVPWKSRLALILGVSILSGMQNAWAAEEQEPNGKFEDANPLRLDETATGTLTGQDRDYYRLAVGEGGRQIMQINLSGVPDVDTRLYLYTADGKLIKDSNIAKKGGAERIVNVGISDKTTYFVQVRALKGLNENKPYRLRIEQVAEALAGQEWEPNDKVDQANTLTLNEPMSGLYQWRDKDYYRLEIPGSLDEPVQITLTGVPRVAARLVLEDTAGERLASASAEKAGRGFALKDLELAAGTYLLRVTGGSDWNHDRPYKLVAKAGGKPAFTPGVGSNSAVRMELTAREFQNTILDRTAPPEQVFLVLDTLWENIQAKRKVPKSQLEGKRDITKGIGGLGFHQGAGAGEEMVEVDVPYGLPNLSQHVNLLADGFQVELHEITGTIPGGLNAEQPFQLAKSGEVQEGRLVYLVPLTAEHIALQLLDNSHGHILVAVQGNPEKARDAGPAESVEAKVDTAVGSFLVQGVDFQTEYAGKIAPAGWQYALFNLGGKGARGADGQAQSLEFRLKDSAWARSPESHLYSCGTATVAGESSLRFGQAYQMHTVGCLVPETVDQVDLGLRLGNEVAWLAMTEPKPPPKPLATGRDGDLLELALYGVRTERDLTILDLGLRSLTQKGLEIQPAAQFALEVGGKTIRFESSATEELLHSPPKPFVVPPQTFLRFELAYHTDEPPSALRYRGFAENAVVTLQGKGVLPSAAVDSGTDTEPTKPQGGVIEESSSAQTSAAAEPLAEASPQVGTLLTKSNKNIQLTVLDYTVRETLGRKQAGKGNVFVVVSTRWQSLADVTQTKDPSGHRGLATFGQTSVTQAGYSLDSLVDHLFLVVDGRYTAPIAPETHLLAQALDLGRLTIPAKGPELHGSAAFLVDRSHLDRLTLALFDSKSGNIELPLKGDGVIERKEPVLERQAGSQIEVAVYGWTCQKDRCRVDMGFKSSVSDKDVVFGLSPYVYVVEDGYYYQSALDEPVPYTLQDVSRFRPGQEQRGHFVFPAPVAGKHVGLFIGLGGSESLRFNLTPQIPPPALPAATLSFSDGSSANIFVLAASYRMTIDDDAPVLGKRYLVLDTLVSCPEGSGAGFRLQPEKQFVLLDSVGQEIRLSPITEKIAHGATANLPLLQGMQRRFSLVYEVPAEEKDLRLDYRGFEQSSNHALIISVAGSDADAGNRAVLLGDQTDEQHDMSASYIDDAVDENASKTMSTAAQPTADSAVETATDAPIPTATTESEPNDKREAANSIPLGGLVTGTHNKKRDEDWYRFEVPGPATTVLRLELSDVTDIKHSLKVLDAKRKELKSAQAKHGVVIPNLAAAPGIYYAVVSANHQKPDETYRLQVQSLGPWGEAQEREPNDKREQASPLHLGKPVTGFATLKGSERDWYRLDVDIPGRTTVRIALSAIEGIDTKFVVHDAQGQRLKNYNAVGRGEAEVVDDFTVSSGTYYIEVYPGSSRATDRYQLLVEEVGPWQPGWEIEPNDERKHTTPLTLGEVVSGYAQPKRDTDFFAFQLTESEHKSLVVDFAGASGLVPKLRLYDADGKEHKLEGVVAAELDPGSYSLRLDHRGTTAAEPYSLSVRPIPEPPVAKIVGADTQVPLGFNLAQEALGGKVEYATSEETNGNMVARNLIDGSAMRWITTRSSLSCQSKVGSCGWSSPYHAPYPQEFILSFHQQREATIGALLLDTLTSSRNKQDLPKLVEVWVSITSASEGFVQVASAQLRDELTEHLITIPATRVKYLKLRILSNYGGTRVRMGEIKLIETPDERGSILADVPKNLVSPALDGTLVRYTSQGGLTARWLSDGSTDTDGWSSRDDYFPQELVFAFREDREALVDRIVLNPRSGYRGKLEPENWPKRIMVAVSSRNPLDGFEEVGEFTLEQKPVAQTFPIGRRARFVKLRILENYGGKHTRLGEVEIYEGNAPDYQSILLEGIDPESAMRQTNTESALDETAFLSETEPNNSIAEANALTLDRFTKGSIDPLGEDDYFRLAVSEGDLRGLSLDLMGRPNIRTSLNLLDQTGQVIRQFSPGSVAAERAQFTWALPGDEYLLSVTEPPVSIVVIWDTSASMKGSAEALEHAVLAYLPQIRPEDRVNLIRFSGKPKVLLPDFTSDKEVLKATAQGQFKPGGGTALYDAILKGMELLQDAGGNRAILVMTDGADTTSKVNHAGFWKHLEKERVRLYTIGLGNGVSAYYPDIATSCHRVLAHAAMTTNGRFFFAPTKDELPAIYQLISDELQSLSTYHLRPSVSQGEGYVSVVSTGERITKAVTPHLELVLDGSGSMRERKRKIDGRLKIDVAKDVMTQLIEDLPEEMEVALRVYGHRIREGRRGDCEDSELLVPFGSVDKKRLLKKVQSIRALGTTPIAYSLEQAAKDFPKGSGEKQIVLVTDGKEECGGDPVAVASKLIEDGLNLRINVVGFALADEATKTVMRRVAEVTGGEFFDAQDQQGLQLGIRAAMQAPFEVLDAADTVVATGQVGGDSVKVPEGIYRVVVYGAGDPIEAPHIKVVRDRYMQVALKKEGEEVGVHVLGPKDREDAQAQLRRPATTLRQSIVLEEPMGIGAALEETPHGLRVTALESEGLAPQAHLQAGDLLTHIDGQPLSTKAALEDALEQVRSGQKAVAILAIRRGFQNIKLEIRGEAPTMPVPEPLKEQAPAVNEQTRVLDAQRWLAEIGFDPGPVDGQWGRRTANAARDFQAWYPAGKLSISGQLDQTTYRAIQEAQRRNLKYTDSTNRRVDQAQQHRKQAEADRRQAKEQQRQREDMLNKGMHLLRDVLGR